MSPEVNSEGASEDLLNLREENGSWKACKNLTEVYDASGYSRLWIHTGSDYKHVLGVSDGTLFWFANITDSGW